MVTHDIGSLEVNGTSPLRAIAADFNKIKSENLIVFSDH